MSEHPHCEPIKVTVTEELLTAIPALEEAGYEVGETVELVGPRPRDRG